MATRFYVPASAPFAGLTPSYDAGWNDTSEATRHELIRAKYASPSSITVGTRVGAWSNTAGQKALDRQLISGPLASQTISGTLSAMFMAREYATTDNVDRPYMAVKVINSSGSVVATLLSLGAQTGSSTGEFINNATHQTQTWASSASLTSYACSAGDRILVEIGYSNSTSATSPEASIKWGENATDATLGDNATTADRAGWIEFSGNLTFQGPAVTSCSPASSRAAGGTSTTITGSGFVNGATVTVGGNSATSVVVVSSTSITCVVPSGSVGQANIVVTNPDSTTGTLTNGWTYTSASPTEAVFTNAGGAQKVIYEAYSAGTYVDSLGLGTNFTQGTGSARPTADTSISPAGQTMLSCDGGDLITGGTIASGSFPTWTNGTIFVEHFIIRRPSSPSNASQERVVDFDGNEYWILSATGAGILYRSGANSDSALSGATVYYVTIEHNVTSGISTTTINGVAQTDTGTCSSTTRTDMIGTKTIGARSNSTEFFTGHVGCWGIGYATTWGSTERAALYQAMQDWYNGAQGAISGTFTASVTFSGTLAGSGALTGSVPVAVTPSGTLNGAGALSGSTSLDLTLAGTLAGAGSLSGSTSLALTPAGTLTGDGALSGSVPLSVLPSGTLTGDGELIGAIPVALTFAGNGVSWAYASGSVPIALTLAGTLAGDGALVGSTTISLTTAGLLVGEGALAGSVPIALAPVGTLTGAGALVGQIPVAVVPAGTLAGVGALVGAIPVALTFAGILGTSDEGSISGSVPLALTFSGTLTGSGALVGSTTFELTPTGLLTGTGALSGSIPLAVAPVGVLGGTGELIGNVPLALSLDGLLGGSGALVGVVPLAVTPSGLLTGAGALTGQIPVSVSPVGTLGGLAALTGQIPITFTFAATIGDAPASPGGFVTVVVGNPAAHAIATPSLATAVIVRANVAVKLGVSS